VTEGSAAVSLRAAEVRVSGGRTILGPVDLDVERGRHWVVLGPNGGGKTTLLSLAGALRHPSRGTVDVLGARLGRVNVRELRSRIGHVSHAIADRIRPGIDVTDVVLTGRSSTLETWFVELDDDDRARARGLLERVGCAHLQGQTFGRCSQGERQRILLARALFARHELLLLDEPAAGLDLPGRETLLRAIEESVELRDGSASAPTTILVTHHLEEIPASTTHAALLREGRFVATGAVDDVLTDDALSETFGMRLRVGSNGRRWSVVSA
jgi:iron complex transport system ATP-binding protein